MKRDIKRCNAIFLGLVILLFSITGCGNKKEEMTGINITALKGPTAMGMVKLMKESEEDSQNGSWQFTIAASVDEVTPKLLQGETDIAAIPANLASVLYHNTEGQIQVLAINTLGVLYIVDMDGSVQSAEDLRGRTIYASGKGATPEFAMEYILSANGIDSEKDLTVEWKSEHSECVSALAGFSSEDSGNGAVALLPQPFVAAAQAKNENIRIALDLTQEWDKLQKSTDQGAMITGVIVGRKEFIEKNPEAVKKFMDAYKESVEYVNQNVEEASALIEEYNIVSAAVAEKALPYCNIVFIEGEEMKNKLSGYLNVLVEQNPKSIGGKIPGDEFYYFR